MARMDGSTAPTGDERQGLSSPELRTVVERYVRSRVPAADVEDVVQTVLCAAVASRRVPDEEEELRRWLIGIARHKVVDLRRQQGRAKLVELGEQGQAEPPPLEAQELARWAERQIPDTPEAERTLGWMAREGAGEKLAHIAADEQLPPERVRQRVSRMRRFLRQQWRAELAAVAALLGAVLVAWLLTRDSGEVAVPIGPEPDTAPVVDPQLERAATLRAEAFEHCEQADWQPCLDGLDEAAKLDPAGDSAPQVQNAREQAAEALSPSPEVSSSEPLPEPAPTTAPPPKKPGPRKDSAPAPKLAPTTAPAPAPKPAPTPKPTAPRPTTTTPAPSLPTSWPPSGYGTTPGGTGRYGSSTPGSAPPSSYRSSGP